MIALRAVLAIILVLSSAGTFAQSVQAEFVVQRSLAAGLRHHEARTVWDSMAAGDSLKLVREPTNAEDINAVRIEWQGVVLGYLAKSENASIARQLDRGTPLRARIVELAKHRNHRLKLALDVYLPL